MRIEELFNPAQLEQEIADRYVSVRVHPDDPTLKIYNYTDKAQIERHWNDVTEHTRGLIVRNGEIVARGWRKFYNAQEHADLNWDAQVGWLLTNKFDGSLGIIYPHPTGGWAVATRGSFDSPQAIEATKMLNEGDTYLDLMMYAGWGQKPLGGWTEVVEIIYPENRIVLDYGTGRELVHLGSVTSEGRTLTFPPGEHVEVVTLTEALGRLGRENAEGWVAHRASDGLMVKLKQEDYLLKHKARFGLNNKVIWRAYSTRGMLTELRTNVPKEYLPWFDRVERQLFSDSCDILGQAMTDDVALQVEMPDATRAEQAAWIKEHATYPHLAFALLDGKNFTKPIFKMVEPKELEWAVPE